jgi:hypothetical protein
MEEHAASSTTADGASVEFELGSAAISLLVGAKVDEEEHKV